MVQQALLNQVVADIRNSSPELLEKRLEQAEHSIFAYDVNLLMNFCATDKPENSKKTHSKTANLTFVPYRWAY